MAKAKKPRAPKSKPRADAYQHKDKDGLLRPDVGIQAQFKKQKPPRTYRYDPSLDPALSWDEGNAERERGEALIRQIREAKSLDGVRAAADSLARMSGPFLNWSGKAERAQFNVPTLPLFTHERLSTRAILETLKSRKRDKQQMLNFFADADLDITDRILKAYEHKAPWVNRLILGDSLIVMNSLLEYEGLGGQVQMIYMDPPYGVKFGSNFQPFVRKRDVKHNDDADMTREPEMVQAYRDTWELGLHSYLTYLRDRLLLCRDLLHPSGSIFVQISDENLHHVREVMDEVFGSENFVVVICYKRLGMMVGKLVKSSAHYLLWYARDIARVKFRKIYEQQVAGVGIGDHYNQLERSLTGEVRPMAKEERGNPQLIPPSWNPFQLVSLQTYGLGSTGKEPYSFEGQVFRPGPNKAWRTTLEGLTRLAEARRVVRAGNTIRYKQFLSDFPYVEVRSIWENTGRDPVNYYVVQTPTNVIERCVLMTTDPGDLVLDPTCGGGATAYVAEEWGRRWITVDCSRVPIALARQRLLTATFPYYQLREPEKGPSGGFVYEHKKNQKGEEIGGIVPHVTLESIAQNQPPEEEVLVDRPEIESGVTRVSGPFVVEATIPTPMEAEDTATQSSGRATQQGVQEGDYIGRMIEILKRTATLRLPGNQTATFTRIRRPARAMDLHAEAEVMERTIEELARDAKPQKEIDTRSGRPVAFIFGPEHGAVTEDMVFRAAKEAHLKNFTHLYVIGFAVQDKATRFIQSCSQVVGIPATYVQATMDVQMADLLKTTRASQVFSVTGSPEVRLIKLEGEGETMYRVELLGMDVFDPVTMDVDHERGENVPAWFLDTDYNEMAFCVSQAFFPRTGAWHNLKRALGGVYEDTVWDHLAGTTSEPFALGEHKRVAVKVIDDRGNELLVVKTAEEAEEE